MASLLELVLGGDVPPDKLVKWLQRRECASSLDQFVSLRQDFIPCFLNFMRDSTLHLIENGLSMSQSPTKTPSAKKAKPEQREQRTGTRSRRGHLFGSEDADKHGTESSFTGDICGVPSQTQALSEKRATSTMCFRNHQQGVSTIDVDRSGSGFPTHCQGYRNDSTFSSTSPPDDSVIAGSSFTDSCSSRSQLNGSSLVSEDSAALPEGAVYDSIAWLKDMSNHAHTQGNKKNQHNGLHTPDAHSTPDRRRSGGRSRRKLSLGEFLAVHELSQSDASTDVLRPVDSKSGGRHSSGKKKQQCVQRQNQQLGKNSNRNKSKSFCIGNLEEFPPVCSPCTPDSVSRVRSSLAQNSPAQMTLFTSETPATTPSPIAWVAPLSRLSSAEQTTSSHVTKQNAWVKSPASVSVSSDAKVPSRVQGKNVAPKNACDHGFVENGIQPICEGQVTVCSRVAIKGCTEAWSAKLCHQTQQNSETQVPRRISLSGLKNAKALAADPVFKQAQVENHQSEESSAVLLHDVAPYSIRSRTQSALLDGGDSGDVCTRRRQEIVSKFVKTNPLPQPALGQKNTSPVKVCSQAQHSIVTPVKGPSRSSVLDRVGTPDKAGLEKSLSIIKLVHACPEEVTHQASLDLLVQLYSACLDAHLFPNLTTELYFITQLLTVQGSEESEFEDGSVSGDIEDINYFKTVHNAVYFAVRILDGQFPLVRQLDRPTLRLLSENERVAEFSPDLHTKLKNAFEAAIDRRNSSTPFTPFRSVSFQADTDNRKNFPSDRTFHLFKKQRDRFYEVLREWEAKKQTPGWNTELRLGDKIRGIVGNKTELANHLHLSRLFLSQLITTCKGAQRQWTKGDYENISSLMELRKMNPDKYLKLQDRFIRPFSYGGPCPPASFPGHQQFFHDFIVAAASPVFNQNLSNLLSSRIAELNDTDFGDAHTAFNKHQMTAEDHESECEAFANTLLMLQLLARFLGLIAFLPYQSPDPLPQNLLQDLAVVRSSMSLPLDLQKYAEDAVKRGRLALTIPWMVEFLALMDPVAPNIDFMRSLLQQLRRILNHSWHHLKVSGFSYSGLLVVTSLGWLFDQPCLPEGHFFAELPSTNKDAQLSFAFSSDSLDGLSLVTQEVFYSCCPYFGEMRYLLTEFSLGARSKTTVRKLNLVTSDNFLPPPVKETKKDVQMELQENFFHLHPASLRRTVEFVSERTASNFIKYLRANSLPDSLAACVKEVGDLLTRMPSVHSSRAKEKAQQEIPLKAQNLCTGQRKKMLEAQKEFCYGRIAESLKLLLPEDHPESVIVTATAIACRIAKTKIQNWIHKNVTVAIYAKKLKEELLRQQKAQAQTSRTEEQTPRTDKLASHADKLGSNTNTLASREVEPNPHAEKPVTHADEPEPHADEPEPHADELDPCTDKQAGLSSPDSHLSDKENVPSQCITAQDSGNCTSQNTWRQSESLMSVTVKNSIPSISQSQIAVKHNSVSSLAPQKKKLQILKTSSHSLSEDFDQSRSESDPSQRRDTTTTTSELGVSGCDSVQLDFTALGKEKPMSDLLRDGQDILSNLMIYSEPVTVEEIHTFLSDVHVSLSTTEEQPPQTKPCLASLTAQLPIAIVCNRPELWTNQMPSLCIGLWRGVLRGYVELSPLHSRLAHNLLAQASADQQVYELLDDFLTTLVKEGLLLDSDLEVDASY